jgi:hypothetical protein
MRTCGDDVVFHGDVSGGRSRTRREQVDSRRIVPTGISVELMARPVREKAFSVRMIPNHVISKSVVCTGGCVREQSALRVVVNRVVSHQIPR